MSYGGSRIAARAAKPGITFDVVLGLTFTVLGVTTYATALRHGTPTAPSAVTTMTGVVFPGALAVLLLGDRVRSGWWRLSGVGLLVAGASVTVLIRRQTDAEKRAKSPSKR
ncbi:hypothetical protein ACQPXB_28150 [Amycolatopsis sp. CA-161197]|uniref:hypothetical protein n=1 Tax=Amycolatopsis sp. CA-161197 TaxID=3239922 RepID=UPI003D920214